MSPGAGARERPKPLAHARSGLGPPPGLGQCSVPGRAKSIPQMSDPQGGRALRRAPSRRGARASGRPSSSSRCARASGRCRARCGARRRSPGPTRPARSGARSRARVRDSSPGSWSSCDRAAEAPAPARRAERDEQHEPLTGRDLGRARPLHADAGAVGADQLRLAVEAWAASAAFHSAGESSGPPATKSHRCRPSTCVARAAQQPQLGGVGVDVAPLVVDERHRRSWTA